MNRRKIYFLFCLIFAVFICGCSNKKETKAREVPTGKVQKGTFYIDLYEEGEIEAVNSINISSPNISWRYGNLKITELVRDGQDVSVGDTLIIFDQSEVHKGIAEAEGRLEISLAELEKMKAQHQSELEELNADFEITRISQEISKINFESAAYESEIRKKEIQLNLEKADIALERAKEQIDNRKKVQQEEIKQKNLSIQQDRSQLNEAYQTLDRMIVTTPSPGIAILSNNWSTGNKYQIGDQCWSGTPLIQLPDLSLLKAIVKINEVDIAKISKNLRVEIKPDAFSDSTFNGKVNSVANLAVNKDNSSKIKVFPVEILINETNENLLPGLTVSCRIIVDEIEDVMFVPLNAVFMEGDKSYVYKKSGSGFDKTEVEIGLTNSDYVIITKGLNEKDTFALINPFAEDEEKETEKAS